MMVCYCYNIIVGLAVVSHWALSTPTYKLLDLGNPAAWIESHNKAANFYEMIQIVELNTLNDWSVQETSLVLLDALNKSAHQSSKKYKLETAFQTMGYLNMITFDLMEEYVCQSQTTDFESICKEYFQQDEVKTTLNHMHNAFSSLMHFLWSNGTSDEEKLLQTISNMQWATSLLRHMNRMNAEDLGITGYPADYQDPHFSPNLEKSVRFLNEKSVYNKWLRYGIYCTIGPFILYGIILIFRRHLRTSYGNDIIHHEC